MNLKEIAIEYSQKNNLSVIPLKGKIPCVKWKQYHNKQATEQEIENWFKANPNITGIGVVTGKISDIVVVDFDSKDAVQAFNELCQKYDGHLVACPQAKSGSGGLHCYFKYPSNGQLSKLKNLAGSLSKLDPRLSKLDMRADGGQVVLPPSLHPSGNRYEWTLSIDDYLKTHDELPELPQWFLNAIIQKQQRTPAHKQPASGKQSAVSSSLIKLTNQQLETYQKAVQMPYVQGILNKRDASDQSKSDFALTRALVNEGIRDTEILCYAIQKNPHSKWNREGGGEHYQEGLVEDALTKDGGMTLEYARRKLEVEFIRKIRKNLGKGVFAVVPPISTGKSYQAIKLVVNALEQGIKSLILVETHTLADEWIVKIQKKIDGNSQLGDVKPVHLYSATHDEVDCLCKKQAIRLFELGHSALFKRQFCGRCEKKDDCKHLKSYAKAKDAGILVGVHAHGTITPKFFSVKSHGNHQRKLFIFDEMPEVVNEITLEGEALKSNLELFKELDDGDFDYEVLINLLKDLLKAFNQSKNYTPDDTIEWWKEIDDSKMHRINQTITSYYSEKRRGLKAKANLLHKLVYLVNHPKVEVRYNKIPKWLSYTWRLPPRVTRGMAATSLFMSATTSAEYLEEQLQLPEGNITEIGAGWKVNRNNLKIVQLVNVTGGRGKLLSDKKRQDDTKKTLDLVFTAHKGRKIVLICPLGKNAKKYYAIGNRTAKKFIIDQLQPIARKHKRKLKAISTRDIQVGDVPDGIAEVPVIHKISGINSLAGFEVIVELCAMFYSPEAIKENMLRKFDMDISDLKPTKQKVMFKTADRREIPLDKYIYPHELVELEREYTERAGLKQTEGRPSRDEEFHVTIYRLHGENIEPYPHRVYKSWVVFWRYEFGHLVAPEKILSDDQLKLWEYIRDNFGDKQFTRKDLPILMRFDKNLLTYLKILTQLGLIKQVNQGKKGRGNVSTYQLARNQLSKLQGDDCLNA